MCGRFVSSSSPDKIASYFDVAHVDEQLLERGPNYNTAPTTPVFVVHEDGGTRQLDAFHWGLVPSWAKDRKIGARMINARAETLADKPAFKRAFARRRCIVPADGFYEWTQADSAAQASSGPQADSGAQGGAGSKGTGSKKARKQPWFIHRPDGEPYAFAGIWEVWKGPKGAPTAAEGASSLPEPGPADPLRSCSIITTAANETMSALHDRMPVILPRSAWDEWLSPEVDDLDLLGRLLVPASEDLITFHAVSTEVNNARNKGEHLVAAVDPATGEPL